MIDRLHAVALGLVQGLTEFLPVSSSAHLALMPWLFGWPDPGLAFDVALHLGTLAALLAYYWRDWVEMVASLFNRNGGQRHLLLLLIVASIPGAVFGVLLEKRAETTFRSPALIAVALAALGVALWWADKHSDESREIGEIGLRDAILIGLSQALALIPGVSRSGITITAARALGIRRQDAANFSFLMATPIIAGAGLLKAHEMAHAASAGALAAGFVAATLAGFLAISALVRYVRTRSYVPFSLYRIALAALVIVIFATSE
jgi:undecaprenyl-diphosphatase